jgi:hypothetical protein
MDLVDCPSWGVTWNGVGADIDATNLESLTILDRLTASKGFDFGCKSDRLSAFDDSVEFEDVIPMSVGQEDFSEGKFMSFEGGEERIGTGPSIESGGEKSFWVPDEVVVHRHIGERGGKLKNVWGEGGGRGVPVAVG